MLNLWLGERVPNELLFYAYNDGRLNAEFDVDTPKFGRALRTTCDAGIQLCLGDLLPGLKKQYPDRAGILRLVPTDAPHFRIIDNQQVELSAEANVFVYVEADAVSKNSRRIVLVTNVTTTVQMYDISVQQIQNTVRLFGKVKVKDMMIHVRVSRIDGILPDTDMLELRDWVEYFLENEINAVLAAGIPFPNIEGVTFVHPQLTTDDSVIIASSDYEIDKNVFAAKIQQFINEQFNNGLFR